MENEEEVVTPQVDEVVEEVVEVEIPVVDKEAEARRQLTARAKAAEAKARELEARLKSVTPAGPLDVSDYIDISTALDGLDQREKARLAEEHKLSGKSLKDIRESEDYQLWQSAYRTKQEKENALKPSSNQPLEPQPKSVNKQFAEASSLAEQEELLKKYGLYKENRPRADRVTIGSPLSR
jgi:preprotein translocase subunit SecD